MNCESLEQAGYAIVPSVIGGAECDELLSHVSEAGVSTAGTRNLLRSPWCESLATSLKQHPSLANLLPLQPVAVQCTLFVKSPANNWLVSLHQDLSIPVHEKIDDSGCSGWSEKEGIIYTQPPTHVLENLVAVRIQLDECGADSGSLRVVPTSHRLGRLAEADIAANREHFIEADCHVPRGGALVMRPLLLHASSKTRSHSHRHVLHFVFGPAVLPYGLRWHCAV